MEDQAIEFNTSVKCYGGVILDENEKEALRLQPNYAVYDEVDDLAFLGNVEKTLNALRWNEAICRSREEEEEEASTSRRQQDENDEGVDGRARASALNE